MKNKQMIFKILIIFSLVILLTACGSKNGDYELMTLEDIKENIQYQELTLLKLDIPYSMISRVAVNQAGYEIGNSGDKIYIYEYKSNEKLKEDKTKIHNNFNGQSIPPIIMSNYNICLVYMKKDKNEYEIENKILKAF
ncbi:hypothetical protein [Paenibacillus sp. SYP-B4298]|uniref:hypothetical protein n=1 Tax=Paenibacillus sp. SYP-B4298 TaxID=2996034 RepID=UPI0022DCEDDF|nr:hypothetical protein [Paenibacillus sp. SYP-B4298]